MEGYVDLATLLLKGWLNPKLSTNGDSSFFLYPLLILSGPQDLTE